MFNLDDDIHWQARQLLLVSPSRSIMYVNLWCRLCRCSGVAIHHCLTPSQSPYPDAPGEQQQDIHSVNRQAI